MDVYGKYILKEIDGFKPDRIKADSLVCKPAVICQDRPNAGAVLTHYQYGMLTGTSSHLVVSHDYVAALWG